MKKDINLPLVAALSVSLLALSACEKDDANNSGWEASNATRVCVDQDGHRTDDGNCQQASYAHGSVYPYWYYFNRGGHVPPVGDSVTGGSRTPMSGVNYEAPTASFTHADPESVSRGGFGGAAEGFGGGHGGVGE